MVDGVINSTAPEGYYEFSQYTNGTVHLSFSVGTPAQGYRPVNMQLSIDAAQRLLAGVHQSLCRHTDSLRNRIVAIDDTLKDTLRKNEAELHALREAVQSVADTEAGWLSADCRAKVNAAIAKRTEDKCGDSSGG